MHDELVARYGDALDDLHKLTSHEPSHLRCTEFRGLARVVMGQLRVRVQVSDNCRADILTWLLPRVVNRVRDRAINSLVSESYRRDKTLFKAAAATELLKVEKAHWDEQRKRLLAIRREEMPGDSEATERPRYRRLLAAAWLGVGRTTLQTEADDELFEAFIDEMLRFLLDSDTQGYLQNLIDHDAKTAADSQEASISPQHIAVPVGARNRRPVTLDVRDALIELANQVGKRLREEQEANRVGRAPAFPLGRRLVQDESHVDDPRNVVEFWGVDPGDSRWESDSVKDLAELVSAAPRAVLVVLGQGGAGKSTLAASLTLKVLESAGRPEGDPVPVIFPLSSWNPHKQPNLSDWLIERLAAEHRALKRAGRGKDSWAKRLVDGGYIMPILDGFDEIDGLVRPVALRSINSWVERRNSVVLLSREREYFHAVAVSRPLVGAAIVELQNAELGAVEEYLGRTTNRGAEWAKIFAQIRIYPASDLGVVLGIVLTLPLMAMLAGAIYDLADGSESAEQRSPAELLNAERFSSVEALTEHLLDAFVQVRLTSRLMVSDSKRTRAWDHVDARKWLGFLAAALVVEKKSEFRWWTPGKVFDAAIDTILGLLAFAAIAAGIFAFVATDSLREALGHPAGLFVVLYVASFAFHMIISVLEPPVSAWCFGGSAKDAWSASSAPGWIGFNLIVAVVASAAFGASQSSFIAFVVALTISSAGLYFLPPAFVERQSPPALLRSDRIAALLRGGFVSGPLVIWSLVSWVVTGRSEYLGAISVAAVFLGFSVLSAASTLWWLRSGSLATRGRLPWRTMLFLQDTHRRGVLRQSGGVYQFRHAALLGYLAGEHINNLPGQWAFVDPDYAQGLLVVSKFWSGAYDDADKKLRDMIVEHEESKESGKANQKRLLLVEVLRGKGQLDRAAAELKRYLSEASEDRFGGHLENRLLLVEILAELGDFDKAQIAGDELLSEIEKQNRWYRPAHDKALAMKGRLREHPLFTFDDAQ